MQVSGRRTSFAYLFFPPLLQSNIFRYLEFTEDYVWSYGLFERITQQHDHEGRRKTESKRMMTVPERKLLNESAFLLSNEGENKLKVTRGLMRLDNTGNPSQQLTIYHVIFFKDACCTGSK